MSEENIPRPDGNGVQGGNCRPNEDESRPPTYTLKVEPASFELKGGEVTLRIRNFIETIVDAHNASGRFGGNVVTRFPPEPNGYLHIGHAKSICINFGLADQYGGTTNLRFDDTNPVTEETEYVDSIMESVRWLGFEWDALYYASDYFEQLYAWAEQLITQGDAYVCDLAGDEISEYRGGWNRAGKDSPYRGRPVEESLDLFRRMRAGEFPDGSRTLRAKIDMGSPNMNMRDPIMYRIVHARHHRTGDAWCIYPTYDYAHGESDSIEGITHSICTLEFEDHRPLYDWFVEKLGIHAPQQIEFARLNLTHTVMSKRRLLELVKQGLVSGWDDPRMPTLVGLRRRGYTPAAIRSFCERIGVTKMNSQISMGRLEEAVREDLNRTALRRMAVLRPIKVVLTNLGPDERRPFEATNNPEDPSAGTRTVHLTREIFIDADDFMEVPAKKYFRLSPGGAVRLRAAGLLLCEEVVKAADGSIAELRGRFLPEEGAALPEGVKVKATIQWVSAADAVEAEVRLYDTLLTIEDLADVPAGTTWTEYLNPESLTVLTGCRVEPALAGATPDAPVQFERIGYFVADSRDSRPGRLVFNRTVGLRDEWSKVQKQGD